MPAPLLPPRLQPIVENFLRTHESFLQSQDGREALKSVESFRRRIETESQHVLSAQEAAKSAAAVVGWVGRLPRELYSDRDAPILDLAGMSTEQVGQALSESIQALVIGAAALMAGGAAQDPKADAAVLHMAFGADAASIAIRRAIIDPHRPPVPLPKGFTLVDLQRLIIDKELNKLLSSFARCGIDGARTRAWIDQFQPIGTIISISPPRACAGQRVTIRYRGFGAAPPAGATAITLSLRHANGNCQHLPMLSIRRDAMLGGSLLDENGRRIPLWNDSGEFIVTLPEGIDTGCIGFFAIPEQPADLGTCSAADLGTAAGMFQSALADGFGPAGALQGQVVVDLAGKVIQGQLSLASHRPCAPCQPDNANLLKAGPPRGAVITVDERGYIYPRGYVTLRWSVTNAETIEIEARNTPGSENSHELPPIQGPLPATGQRVVPISCTKRWEGKYVLRASNANGCGVETVEAEVSLVSGFSHYLVGVSKVDITDARPGLGMAGFAYKKQTTTDYSIDLRQYARAFVVAENKPGGGELTVIVVADLWICSEAVKREVLNEVNRSIRGPRLRAENLLIAATHTHAGPGGYSDYFLYNLTIGGFDQRVFDTIVNGIVGAIIGAYVGRVPGRLQIEKGDLVNCGANRSFEAYKLNPEYDGGSRPDQWTDREMTVIRVLRDVNNRGATTAIGLINWFAIHPTSLGMYNGKISGDNKGWAAEQLEGNSAFVAGFANGCAGDVSGNVEFDEKGEPLSANPPLGGVHNPDLTKRDMSADIARMKKIAKQQADRAFELANRARTEITGTITIRHAWIDMANVPILDNNGAPTGERTHEAALGVSFGAGSSEDSLAFATLPEGDVDANIIEGMRHGDMIAAGAAAVTILTGLISIDPVAVIALVLCLTTGACIVPPLRPRIAGIVKLIPNAGVRSFISSVFAGISFHGTELKDKGPKSADGTWEWKSANIFNYPPGFAAGHGAKPIMFPVGLTKLSFAPNPGSADPARIVDCPLVPHILPLQLIRIGDLMIVCLPAEFTVTAGRRLKARLKQVLGPQIRHIVMSGYSNAYASYVTTPQEYESQQYEGASVLYGPHTLQAYFQGFETLARALMRGDPAPTTDPFKPAAFQVPAVYRI